MTTTTQPTIVLQPHGPLQKAYKSAKSILPKISNSQIVANIDLKIIQASQVCDKIILQTSNAVKGALEKLPPPSKIRGYVVQSSQKAIERLQGFLNSTIEILGGKILQVKQETQDATSRLLNIVAKVIQVNSLLVKNTTNQILEYVQHPFTLIEDTKVNANKLYIEVSAISITLRDLLQDAATQILGGLNARYTETRNKVKVLLTKIDNPQKAYNLLSQKLVDVKNVTIEKVQQGIQIVMDRQHYYDNFKKITQAILDAINTLTSKADVAFEPTTSFSKEMYEKTVKNYKIQKILLTGPKQQAN